MTTANVLDDLFSFDNVVPSTQNKTVDPFLDFNAPLISSTGTNMIQQQNQMDTFKNLYTNVGQ